MLEIYISGGSNTNLFMHVKYVCDKQNLQPNEILDNL